MQLEAKKRNPDREKVSKLMGITFHQRRSLLSTGIGIADFLEQFPCLLWKNEMLREMSEIMKSNVSIDEFKARLESVAPALSSLGKNKVENDCKLSAALAVLPELLREKSSAIMVFEDQKEAHPHPHIRTNKNGGYNLVCEGVQLLVSEDLPEVWYFLLGAYYVYDLKYPKQAQNTLTFMEVKFFDINKENLPRRTHSLLTELAKRM